MKNLFFLIATFLVITSKGQTSAQINSDTIEINPEGYLLKGKPINPYSKNSVLKIFPESNSEYLLARKHRTRGLRFFGAGALMFASTAFYRKSDAQIPMMIGGAIVASFVWLQIPKMRKHIEKSISIYNQEIILQKK
jgi:hypothetical protein